MPRPLLLFLAVFKELWGRLAPITRVTVVLLLALGVLILLRPHPRAGGTAVQGGNQGQGDAQSRLSEWRKFASGWCGDIMRDLVGDRLMSNGQVSAYIDAPVVGYITVRYNIQFTNSPPDHYLCHFDPSIPKPILEMTRD